LDFWHFGRSWHRFQTLAGVIARLGLGFQAEMKPLKVPAQAGKQTKLKKRGVKMDKNYILAVLQSAADGQDLERRKFGIVADAVAWLRKNCKPAQVNGTIFEINGQYDYCVGYVEYSSNGAPITKSLQNDSKLLCNVNFWAD